MVWVGCVQGEYCNPDWNFNGFGISRNIGTPNCKHKIAAQRAGICLSPSRLRENRFNVHPFGLIEVVFKVYMSLA
jgi:hypothetical protein